jgi:hypothetical protein
LATFLLGEAPFPALAFEALDLADDGAVAAAAAAGAAAAGFALVLPPKNDRMS